MLKTSLQLRLGQQLTMTPQLQQAIRLLQLPVIDLQAQIQEALETNVMLDAEEPAEPTGDAAEERREASETPAAESTDAEEPYLDVETSDSADWSDDISAGPADSPRSRSDGSEQMEFADRSGESLHDHLRWQVQMENFDPRSRVIAEAIIDSINDDGYLAATLDDLQATLAPEVVADEDEIEAVLHMVQRLDPAGIAARSLAECVLLQLAQLAPDTPGLAAARRLATEHLDLLAEQQLPALRRRLRIDEMELAAAISLVRGCHPRPGAIIQPAAPDYVVPDVFVRKIDRRWIVELNASSFPRLSVNQTYAGALGRGSGNDVLRGQLQEARWLIRSLEIRNETLLKVASCIVERQQGFLDHGDEHMKPMVLKDVAEAVAMHESTISRVTMNKYMHTPRGIIEFRHFFSSQVGGEDGDAQSSTAVRAKIRKLIGQEPRGKPLSDSKLAELLSADGVQVARRTVAKYREAMHIPSSSERKRMNMR
ncbi:MAG: RNA polymerase factor sigma-54 [Gammaproteobacteria bacterium]|nr:MAG: RNA polymerase factor sigma-54 [Gammaproteobacteria bacterium]